MATLDTKLANVSQGNKTITFEGICPVGQSSFASLPDKISLSLFLQVNIYSY